VALAHLTVARHLKPPDRWPRPNVYRRIWFQSVGRNGQRSPYSADALLLTTRGLVESTASRANALS
jgi:hypothetical protein